MTHVQLLTVHAGSFIGQHQVIGGLNSPSGKELHQIPNQRIAAALYSQKRHVALYLEGYIRERDQIVPVTETRS